MTYKILLPVDGSDTSIRAAQHVARLATMMQALEVIIINVQPPGDDWMVGRMIKPDELTKMEQEWGDNAMLPERDILHASGVTCQMQMVQGDVASTVVRLAKELSCQQIIMGLQDDSSTLGDWLLGSVASKVLRQASVPVTFVK